ncbi:hypothetical protein GPJ56_009224 [Histomonas meleagridis]|uniref:uncharacterized protein n=1 Tax=Histomonas meleagridis TaxID=135588 RepID=UPI003559AA0D|nr:hypothetical protein GPJ56_009224 [Histomonas meleagridis]KAH0801596.1 hypothetical protein GO595_005595 [Histomonas meleagridis]
MIKFSKPKKDVKSLDFNNLVEKDKRSFMSYDILGCPGQIKTKMAKGAGETKIAVTASAGGGGFKMGKRGKYQIGQQFSPNGALILTAGLIGTTLLLHFIGRFIH